MEDRKIIELYNYRSENACRNDTYLGAWMTIPPIIPDNLKAYLLKIARNQALKKYEYIHAAKRDIDKCVPYEELSNYLAKEYMDDWRENELKEQIDIFMTSLSKSHRQIFILRYWYFMPVKEIAKCTNMSISKVESILFRTRKKLKKQLTEIFMKTNIFYAMNEIDDKYILEAAQCLEHKNTGRNYRLNRDKCLNNKWMTHIVAAILIIVFVFTTGSIINATTHGKIVQWITQLFGAEIVTRENRSLIGKEINDNSVPEVTYSGERCIKQIDKNPIDNSNIIKGVANENIVLPSSISEFEVKNEVTPEIIMTNGSMAVFYVNNYKGWNCKEGDTLTFSFEKYKSETVQKQTFVIGYIRDGIMYEGESMRNIVGSYTLTIKEDGEYNLYIISSTSDYLTIKQGIINHERKKED